MSRQMRHYPQPKSYEDEINPWNADDSPNIIGYQYLSFTQNPNRHTIAFNPESNQKKEQQRRGKEGHINNFATNLRKYEKKKAKELQIKSQTNYIQKNRKELIEDLSHQTMEDRHTSTATSTLFQHEKGFRGHSDCMQPSGELVNWSLIMYYDNQKAKRKHNHKDIQSFLKFHSRKIDRSPKKYEVEQHFDNHPDLLKMEHDAFQKMLKLREGIRKRNLKSASSSRQNLESSQIVEEEQMTTPKKIIHSENVTPRKSPRRVIPRTSEQSRNKPSRILECRAEVVGNPNSFCLAKKDESNERRMIHSSHKGRAQPKVLNIEGSKM